MNINININKEINLDENLIKIIVIVLIAIVFLGAIFLSNDSNESAELPSVLASSENVLIFVKEKNSGMQDLKMTGYFSENKLDTYEISYYIEYESDEYAQDECKRINFGVTEKEDIKYHYSVIDNRLYTKIEYIVENISPEILKSNFGTSSQNSISRKVFREYAQKQGYLEL